jgi:hypothetical protein
MTNAARKIVLESTLFTQYPLVPSDTSFRYEPAEEFDSGEDGMEMVRVQFETIRARLVTPIPTRGKRLVRGDKVVDVHYHLLHLASFSDYTDPVVLYTATSLVREMGWQKGGRQVGLVRDAVDYLYRTQLEFEGVFSDEILRDRPTERSESTHLLMKRSTPKRERGPHGANLSYVIYNPWYLRSIKNNKNVQIDVEMLSQMPGVMGKAVLRTMSWMRAAGLDRIALDELFERVGSTARRRYRSDAEAAFGRAWALMERYRYLRRTPRFEKGEDGREVVQFDWGEPVVLPHRGDVLFRALADAGVNPRTAEGMILEDRVRAARVVQRYKAGGLGSPRSTPAALLVGAFRQEGWDLGVVSAEEQLEMDTLMGRPAQRDPREIVVSPPPEPVAMTPSRATLTPAAGRDGGAGDWDELVREVLVPLLRSCGEKEPDQALRRPRVEAKLRPVCERLGRRSVEATLGAAESYLKAAKRPISYLMTTLENELGAVPPAPAAPPFRPAPASEPRRGVASPERISIAPSFGSELDAWTASVHPGAARADLRSALRIAGERAEKASGTEAERWLRLKEQAATLLAGDSG